MTEDPALPRQRATDSLRERATALLSDALSDGRITLSEFDERSAAATAPIVRLRGVALLGDVEVVRKPRGERTV
ncbi:DUF1707 domain-containing protein [Corynebacterium senegalense]|uniref:DUF1707 SHOCT-like domain-containing protein n=1 Tax=Corynebacterium senegalense TaxID=2080750 RepID=UPI000E1FFDF9|nr:DUF1707 domain-containing protein [Corynebacterium senegalense]